jgi:hypothetical protein
MPTQRDLPWRPTWGDDPWTEAHHLDADRAAEDVRRYVRRIKRGDPGLPIPSVRETTNGHGSGWWFLPVVAEPRPDVAPELRAAVARFDARLLVAELTAQEAAERERRRRRAEEDLRRARGGT